MFGTTISIINQENGPTDRLVGQSDGGNSSTEAPSFWVTLISVKVTKRNQNKITAGYLTNM